jgi:hypothetical protein
MWSDMMLENLNGGARRDDCCRQQLGKHIPAAMNTRATDFGIEYMLYEIVNM